MATEKRTFKTLRLQDGVAVAKRFRDGESIFIQLVDKSWLLVTHAFKSGQFSDARMFVDYMKANGIAITDVKAIACCYPVSVRNNPKYRKEYTSRVIGTLNGVTNIIFERDCVKCVSTDYDKEDWNIYKDRRVKGKRER
jgi:hypothetical protein